jgi:hypothetical protein
VSGFVEIRGRIETGKHRLIEAVGERTSQSGDEPHLGAVLGQRARRELRAVGHERGAAPDRGCLHEHMCDAERVRLDVGHQPNRPGGSSHLRGDASSTRETHRERVEIRADGESRGDRVAPTQYRDRAVVREGQRVGETRRGAVLVEQLHRLPCGVGGVARTQHTRAEPPQRGRRDMVGKQPSTRDDEARGVVGERSEAVGRL